MTRSFNIFRLMACAFAGVILCSSCRKNSSVIAPDPFYTVTVEGFKVTFNNQSKDAASYRWDFGDGDTSSEANPTHTYRSKGKYVPTLYATGSNGTTKEASTVLHLSKGSAIKLNDHTLSDWDTVVTNVVRPGPGAGKFIVSKYDYDGNNVYVYFEIHGAKADAYIYDIYLDADNNPATGYLTGEIPNGAYEVLLEGTIFDDLGSYYHSGDQASFGYADAGLSDFYTIGTTQESGGVLKFEFALKRSKIKGLTGQGMKVGVQVWSAGYGALIAYSPDPGSDAFFLDMSE